MPALLDFIAGGRLQGLSLILGLFRVIRLVPSGKRRTSGGVLRSRARFVLQDLN
jgi:hypothetical protein